MTEKTKNLWTALLAFQQEMTTVSKDGKANYGEYVTLPKVIAEVQPVLNDHGLLITQFPTQTLDGQPGLRTILAHPESGETIEDISPLTIAKQDPQAQGSAITYMRRYGYAAVTQIVIDEDDDGQKASHAATQQGLAQAREQINNTQPPKAIKPQIDVPMAGSEIDPETFKELNFLPSKIGLSKEQAKEVWNDLYQVGIYRGKFDPSSKQWSGTKIKASQVGLIVGSLADKAGYSDENKQILIAQFVGDPNNDTAINDLDQYSDAPFDDSEPF